MSFQVIQKLKSNFGGNKDEEEGPTSTLQLSYEKMLPPRIEYHGFNDEGRLLPKKIMRIYCYCEPPTESKSVNGCLIDSQ